MRKAWKWMIAIALLMAVSACFGAAAEELDPDSWTVLIYMCGADLETNDGAMSYSLNEIAQSINTVSVSFIEDDWLEKAQSESGKERIHVLIETGGAAHWHADNTRKYPALQGMKVSSDKLQRYMRREEPGITGLTLLEELPLQSMADQETLGDFIQWGVRNYPAAHYVLILTGHGEGSRTGLLYDQLFNDDFFYLDQLREALEIGGVVFDVLGIHSCLMANLETAVVVQPYAQYLVSSEEYTPAAGLNYKDLLSELYKNPRMDAYKLARQFCDTIDQKYSSAYENKQYADMLTYSVIDLKKITTLARAFEDLFSDLCYLYENKPGIFNMASYCILNAETYGLDNERMRDLGSILRGNYSLQKCIQRDVWQRCADALDEAVVYLVRGSARGYSSGLSFCYDPAMSAGQMEAYARNCWCVPLLALLDAINDEWTAPEWVYEENPMLKDLKSQTAYDIHYEIEAGEDGPVLRMEDVFASGILGLSNVEYLLYRESEKEDESPYLIGHDAARATSQMYADGRISEEYTLDINGIWPVIDGVLCPIELIRDYDDYVLYNTPILCDDTIYRMREIYRNNSDKYDVTVEDGTYTIREQTLGEFEFLGLWDGYDANVTHPYHNIVPLSQFQGRKYQLLYQLYDARNSGKIRYRKGPLLTVYRSLAIEEAPLPPGIYYSAFVIRDIFCRTTTTDLIKMEWDGKTMKILNE